MDSYPTRLLTVYCRWVLYYYITDFLFTINHSVLVSKLLWKYTVLICDRGIWQSSFLVLPLAELFIIDPDLSGEHPCPWSILEFIPFICMLYKPVCLRNKSQVKKVLLSHWSISYVLMAVLIELYIVLVCIYPDCWWPSWYDVTHTGATWGTSLYRVKFEFRGIGELCTFIYGYRPTG